MTKSIRFTKMHGAGNDYIYVNTMAYPIDNPEELSIAWSKPHTGIGSDGLVLIGSSDIADFSMHIYNADGSEAMMCGNASRCIGKYVYEAGLTQKNKVTLETLSGIKELQLKIEREEVTEVTVDMGKPAVGEIALEVEAGGEIYTGTVISMGNPHLVIFVDEMDQVDLASVGPLLECLPLFPDRTNVEFVQVLKPDEVRMRAWEEKDDGTELLHLQKPAGCKTSGDGTSGGSCGRSVRADTRGVGYGQGAGGTADTRFQQAFGRPFRSSGLRSPSTGTGRIGTVRA